jgi:hypothetical protein
LAEAIVSDSESGKRNVTVRLRHETVHCAGTEDDMYEVARRHALALLDRGFRLGGRFDARRDELHER